MRAAATFEIASWDEDTVNERDGTRLARTHVTKRFSGEVEGTSSVESLMAYTDGAPAAYVGLERFVVAVAGRAGSFVLLHSGTMSATGGELTLTVVPGSGAGDLVGLAGSAVIGQDASDGHTFELDYSLGG